MAQYACNTNGQKHRSPTINFAIQNGIPYERNDFETIQDP